MIWKKKLLKQKRKEKREKKKTKASKYPYYLNVYRKSSGKKSETHAKWNLKEEEEKKQVFIVAYKIYDEIKISKKWTVSEKLHYSIDSFYLFFSSNNFDCDWIIHINLFSVLVFLSNVQSFCFKT